MALKVITASQPMRIKNLIVFVYGDPGVGKTSLAYSAKNPILFDFDTGAHRAGKFRIGTTVPVEHWSDVSQLSAADLAGYDTVIIDTAGRMLDSIINDLVSDAKNCRRGSKELAIQGYGTLNKRFTGWLNLLRSFGKDIVLLAHAAEEKDGENTKIRPDMVGGSKKEAYKVADMMGYMTTVQGQNGAAKALHFTPSQAYHAKDSGAVHNLMLPDLNDEPQTLANIIQRAKDHINSLSESQAQAQNQLNEYRADCMDATNADDLNALVARLDKAHPCYEAMRQAISETTKELPVTFDKAQGKFVDNVEAELVEDAEGAA